MKTFYIYLIAFVFSAPLYCQPGIQKNGKLTDLEKTQLEKAELLFSEKNYRLAMPIYEKLLNNHPGDLKLKYLYGVCSMCNPGSQQSSLNFLKEVAEKNKNASDINFFLAKAHFYNNNFDEALKLAEVYIAELKKPTEEERSEIAQFIAYCNNAKKLIKKPVDVKIENMGSTINSTGAESAPCLTDDESVIYYTYRGERSVGGLQNAFNQSDKNGLYYEDVFTSKKEKGVWQNPLGIAHLNNNNNEAVLSLSGDAQTLFISMDTEEDDGDIYMSKREKGLWSLPAKVDGEVNTIYWEDNCSLSPDGRTLFFASTRPGGFGGKDIYKASLSEDGTWGHVENLGDRINTPLDDDAPFIHYDGRLLLFSSKGHNSMGGYDVFKTNLNLKDSSWSVPENMGYPINSPADENHYVLSPSGDRCYYALGRADGFGDLDIYTVEPGIVGEKPVVAVLKGRITMDNAPGDAEIIAEIPGSNSVFKTVKPNEQNGNYILTLPIGADYRITWKVNGLPVKQEILTTSTLDEYVLKVYDGDFSSKKDTIVGVEIPLATIAEKESLLLNTVKEEIKSDLVFKIQVASGGISNKRKKIVTNEFGGVETITVNEVDKYILKEEYRTLEKAKEMVEKVRSPFVDDAFVVGIYKGKRYHLSELRQMGLLSLK